MSLSWQSGKKDRRRKEDFGKKPGGLKQHNNSYSRGSKGGTTATKSGNRDDEKSNGTQEMGDRGMC